MNQSIFDIMYPKYKITKPIRLIEMFGGYGSQHFALKYLGANVEHWKLVEWAVKSIQAYKDAHYTNTKYDCDETITKEVLVEYLFKMGISFDYNKPATLQEIQRRKFEELKKIALNIKITNNLVNICNVKGKDLEIVDVDKYDYIITYSFPCQDLSLAGLRKGMNDTSTRSGMLWEVERILKELNELGTLPQILLMENVPQVIGTENVNDFNKWQTTLESLGYKNYHQNLIATDYGIPQTRNRTFMISILGDYSYTFPQPIPLKLKLKDMLEDNVDEKYYLSENAIKGMFETDYQQNKYETRVQKEMCSTLCARDYKDPKCVEVFDFRYDEGVRTRVDTEMCPTITCKVGSSGVSGQPLAHDGDSINISQPNSKTRRGRVGKGVAQTLLTNPQIAVVDKIGNYSPSGHNASSIVNNECSAPTVMENHGTITATIDNDLRIRKLTPRECFRLMGVKGEDFENIAKNQSDSSLYHLAGDSIVVNVLMAIFKELL